MKWFRKDPTKRALPPVEVELAPIKAPVDFGAMARQYPRDEALTAMDDALFEHAKAQRQQIDDMALVMLTQTEEPKRGILVESIFHEAGGRDDFTVTLESRVSLSEEVPFGEIVYRTDTQRED